MSTPMNLDPPVPGPAPIGTPGPLYASKVDAEIATIEYHDHTTGKGLQVPTAGLNINADLPFNGYQAAGLLTTQYNGQTAPLATGFQRALYASSAGDLWWNNSAGVGVRITNGPNINLSAAGGISGMTGSAAVVFAAAGGTYSFFSATNVYATLVAAAMQVRNTSGFGWTWRADPAQTTPSYTWQLDGATTPPGSELPMTMTPASAGIVALKTNQIQTAMIANLAVTAAQIANLTITLAKIAASAYTAVSANSLLVQTNTSGKIDPSFQPTPTATAVTLSQVTTPVTTLPSLTGWTAAADCAFWKDTGGMVHMKGLLSLNGGSTGSTAFTLPVGYRPKTGELRHFIVYGLSSDDSGFGLYIMVTIDGTTGNVIPNAAGSGGSFSGSDPFSLDGISFLAEG